MYSFFLKDELKINFFLLNIIFKLDQKKNAVHVLGLKIHLYSINCNKIKARYQINTCMCKNDIELNNQSLKKLSEDKILLHCDTYLLYEPGLLFKTSCLGVYIYFTCLIIGFLLIPHFDIQNY